MNLLEKFLLTMTLAIGASAFSSCGADTVHDEADSKPKSETAENNDPIDTSPETDPSEIANTSTDVQIPDTGTDDGESTERDTSNISTGVDTDSPDKEVQDDGGIEQDEGTETDTTTDIADEDELVRRICEEDCLDFPEAPLVMGNISETVLNQMSSQTAFEGPGPCVLEPQLSDETHPGALFPANWLRPRFRFEPQSDHNVFEIRLHTLRQKHDLVVYTTETTWEMPKEIWKGLSQSAIDEEITVTIRTLNREEASVPQGVQGTFRIAPVNATGKLVYWAADSSEVDPLSSKLAGFAVGEEDNIDVLTINQVGDRDILSTDGRMERAAAYDVGDGCVQCMGCHAATPDGDAVAFTDHWPWNVVVASVEDPETSTVELGKAPPYLTSGAETLLNQPWLGMSTFSQAHWDDQKRMMITSYGERETESGEIVGFTHNTPTTDVLAWFDLKTDADLALPENLEGDVLPQRNALVNASLNNGFGLLSLTGETLSAVTPNWSHDGTTIAYTAASKTVDGRLGGGPMQTDVDIHIVPFNDGLGGPVSALQGASEKDTAEYYPTFSPDDSLIIFNREENFRDTKTVTTFFPPYTDMTIDGSQTPVYYRPHAEIYVIPSKGGTPMRLLANDPPECNGETSPGVINSWGKWAPKVEVSSEEFGPKRTFYWVVFTSARDYPGQFIVERNQYSPIDTRSSQLYLTAIVRNEETGEYTNYPAIYIWNQSSNTTNLTPAWNSFKIPGASK